MAIGADAFRAAEAESSNGIHRVRKVYPALQMEQVLRALCDILNSTSHRWRFEWRIRAGGKSAFDECVFELKQNMDEAELPSSVSNAGVVGFAEIARGPTIGFWHRS